MIDQTTRRRRFAIGSSTGIACAIVIGIYVALGLWMASIHQLCCADDASFALVAKNLANGLGYSTTLNYDNASFTIQPFAPRLGLGPLPILFAAIWIKLLGSEEWVPAASMVLLNAALLACIAVALRSIAGRRAPIVLAVFLVCSIAIDAINAEFWYTMFGEVPAILATIAAYLWWSRPDRTVQHAFVAGALAAAGFLTKELNALYIAPLAISAAFELRRGWRPPVAAMGGLLLLVLAFEMYRFASLGSLSAYIDNWHQHIDFVRLQGSANSLHGIKLFKDRANIFRHAFNVTIWLVLATLILGLLLNENKRLARLLAASATIHLAYWIFMSNGWTRYAYEGVVVACLLLALGMVTSKSRIGKVALTIIALVIVERSGPSIRYQIAMLKPNEAATGISPTLESDRATLGYINSNAKNQRVYTQWWAQVANLEYLSARPLLFEHWYFAPSNDPFWMVINDRLIYKADARFFVLLERCGEPKFVAAPYRVYHCEQSP